MIDTSKAEKLPGVKAVVTAKDIVDFTIEKGAVMLGIQDMRGCAATWWRATRRCSPATPSPPSPRHQKRSRPKPAR